MVDFHRFNKLSYYDFGTHVLHLSFGTQDDPVRHNRVKHLTNILRGYKLTPFERSKGPGCFKQGQRGTGTGTQTQGTAFAGLLNYGRNVAQQLWLYNDLIDQVLKPGQLDFIYHRLNQGRIVNGLPLTGSLQESQLLFLIGIIDLYLK